MNNTNLLIVSLTSLISCTGAFAASVGTFTGGDVGEGLDTQGAFIYALDFGGPGGVDANDANFTSDAVAGVTFSTEFQIPDWHTANYGTTPADEALEAVMRSIRWSSFPTPVTLDLDVVPGQEYKLQLMFAETCCDRGFDISIEGTQEVNNINVGDIQGGINNTTQGVVVTHSFIAGDDQLNIVLQGDQTFPDSNPILNAVTLEYIPPNPVPTMSIWGLGFLAGLLGIIGARRRMK